MELSAHNLAISVDSYTEISNFLQGFVDNEANLSPTASCGGVCSDYRKTSHLQCVSDSLCDRSVNDHEPAKCNGIIRDCQDIDDNDVNICETVNETQPCIILIIPQLLFVADDASNHSASTHIQRENTKPDVNIHVFLYFVFICAGRTKSTVQPYQI